MSDFPTSAQERLLTEYVDTVLDKVFQGQKPHLRDHLLGIAAKVARNHPWPFFEEVVEAEVQRRLAGMTPRTAHEAAWKHSI